MLWLAEMLKPKQKAFSFQSQIHLHYLEKQDRRFFLILQLLSRPVRVVLPGAIP